MQKIASAARRLIIVLALLGLGFLILNNYSYVFSRHVNGEVVRVERVTQPAVFGTATSAAQLYSFAIAVKEANGEIVTSSSEDRQWAVVEKGFCIEARFYPYPPWDLDKGGTYFNARLLKMMECKKAPEAAAAVQAPVGSTGELPAESSAAPPESTPGPTASPLPN